MRIKLLILTAFLFVLSVLLALSCAETAFAAGAPAAPAKVPAYGGVRTIVQPDGSKIEVRGRGDERANWTETADGYSIVKNTKNGFWEYALLELRYEEMGNRSVYRLVLVPSGLPCLRGVELPSGWPKGLHPSGRKN